MKKIATVFALMLISVLMNFSFAQTPNPSSTPHQHPVTAADASEDYSMINGERVYMKTDHMPEFLGGNDAMFSYLQSNIKYPDVAKANKVEGRVFISFTIGRDGTVKNVVLLKGIGSGCDEEALRVANAMPKWTPGQKDGRPVAVQYSLPINFTLGQEKQK
jgi:TonB family protein